MKFIPDDNKRNFAIALALDLAKIYGEENAISGPELAKRFNLDGRRLREHIARERANGALILASEKGYFLPSEDPEKAYYEIRAFTERQRKRIISTSVMSATARSARKEAEALRKDNAI